MTRNKCNILYFENNTDGKSNHFGDSEEALSPIHCHWIHFSRDNVALPWHRIQGMSVWINPCCSPRQFLLIVITWLNKVSNVNAGITYWWPKCQICCVDAVIQVGLLQILQNTGVTNEKMTGFWQPRPVCDNLAFTTSNSLSLPSICYRVIHP